MRLVSVVIPAYNPSSYLLEAVQSVFAQNYNPVEVILVNDGSGPESASLFAEIQKCYPALTLIRLSPNGGVAAARNQGAARAQGKYIAFLDQDDAWAPQKLALQTAYLETHPECAYVTSRQRYFLAQSVTAAPSWVKPEHINTSLPGFLPGTLMVRGAVFRASGGFDEKLKAGTDDVDWFFRANAAGLKTHELPEELLFKRIHQKNLSTQALAHNKELLAVVRMNLQRRKNQSDGAP